MRDVIYKMITDIVDNTVDMVIGEDADVEVGISRAQFLLLPIIPLVPVTKERVNKPKRNSLKQQLEGEEAVKLYESKGGGIPGAGSYP